MKKRALAFAVFLVVFGASSRPSAQSRSYVVRLASASVYDTGSGGRDTVYAALTVFVNGSSKGTAIWDGRGWDGSRVEGRAWDTGLHVFGTSAGSTVQVQTGPVQEGDTIQIVFHVVNASKPPSDANYQSAVDRLRQSSCSGADGGSGWDCIVAQADKILAGWPVSNCEGLVAADKLVYTGTQLRLKTETGATLGIGKFYQGSNPPAGCSSNSIYGANIVIEGE